MHANFVLEWQWVVGSFLSLDFLVQVSCLETVYLLATVSHVRVYRVPKLLEADSTKSSQVLRVQRQLNFVLLLLLF